MSLFLGIGKLGYRRHINGKLIIPLLIVFVPFIFVYDFVLNSAVFYYFDFETQWIPIHRFVQHALISGESVLWNPYIMLGFPQHAESQVGIFYPMNAVLHRFSNQAYAVSLSIYLHLIIGFASTYLLARSYSMGRVVSVHAAVCFAFSGFIFAQLTNYNISLVAVYLPLKLLLITYYFAYKRADFLLYFALVSAAELLISHANTSFITSVTAGLYFLMLAVNRKENLLGNLSLYGLYSAAAIALAAVQIVPTYELIAQSDRSAGMSYEDTTAYSHSLSQYLTLFFPMMYGNRRVDYTGDGNFEELFSYVGTAGIVLALVGALVFLKHRGNRFIAVLGIIGLLGFIVSLGANNPLFELHRWLNGLPGFNFFRAPARWSVVPTLALAIFSAYGLQVFVDWLKKKAYSKALLVTSTITFGAPLLLYGLGWKDKVPDRPSLLSKITQPLEADVSGLGWMDQHLYGPVTQISPLTYYLLIGSIFLIIVGLTAWKLPVKYCSIVIVIIGLLDMLCIIKPVNLRAPADFYSTVPDHISFLQKNAGSYRTITEQDVPNLMSTDNSMGAFYGIQSVKGHIALPLLHYNFLAYQLDDPGILDFVGVKYVIEKSESGYQVSERENFFPRAFLLENYISRQDEEQAFIAFLELNEDERKSYAVITEKTVALLDISEEAVSALTGESAGVRAVRIDTYRHSNVEMSGITEKPAFLILTDMYYPGWQARLNGREAPVIPINGIFRGVYIGEPGSFSLEMVYRPFSFAMGALISLLALITIAINWYWLVGRNIDWRGRVIAMLLSGESTTASPSKSGLREV